MRKEHFFLNKNYSGTNKKSLKRHIHKKICTDQEYSKNSIFPK